MPVEKKPLFDGDAMPAFEAESVAHGTIRFPEASNSKNYAVLLGYRAHW